MPKFLDVTSTSMARDYLNVPSRVTTFYDDFTTKDDGTLTDGDVSDSGHTYNVMGQIPWAITDGRLTHTQTNTATTQSSYACVDIGTDPEDKVGYIWAEYEVPAGADTQEYITLIASSNDFCGTPQYYFSDAAGHCTFTEDDFRYDTLEALNPGLTTNILGRGQYTTLTPGTYRVEITIDDNKATITAPDGKRWRADVDSTIADYSGPFATIQLYSLLGAERKALKILRWGAELQRITRRGAYAPQSEMGLVATTPPRIIGAMQTSGASTLTAITTSLSAKLFGLTIPIPPSRRVLCEGAAWFDQTVPVARAASQLAIGVYPAGVGAYGKLTTVYSGYTPANATVDASAAVDRDGTMSSYANGTLIQFSLVLDLDPAFIVGDPIDFQVKAQANANGLFSFIDSGNASGGFSSIRRSTLKISEL